MKAFVLAIMFMGLAGCAAHGQSQGAYDGVTLAYPHVATEIASQAAGRLAAIYPPARTTLVLPEGKGDFATAFDAALRRHGFAVSSDPGAGVGVEYVLDMVASEASPTCYLRVRMNDGGQFSQLFSIRNGLVVPGPVTQTGLPDVAPAVPPAPIIPSPASVDALAASVEASAPVSLAQAAPYAMETPLKEATLPEQGAPSQPEPTPNQSFISPSPPDLTPSQSVAASVPPESVSLQPQPLPEVEQWIIKPGGLKAQLEEWSARASYQLVWKAANDYQMQSTAIFRDSFIGSIKRLIGRMHLNGNALRVTIYNENHVVEVTED